MYVDASALAAIIKAGPERERFVEDISAARAAVTSAVSIFEAATAFSGNTGGCAASLSEIVDLLRILKVEIVPIDESCMLHIAIARDRYGKGSGHPAKLNLGHCISYGVAKRHRMRLLYKGGDFARTDFA